MKRAANETFWSSCFQERFEVAYAIKCNIRQDIKNKC